MAGGFRNFHIWKGRLPHWRADDVRYYVTFRHRRALNEDERQIVMRQLVMSDGKKWDLLILCVLPEHTELIFTVRDTPKGRPFELSEIVEAAKRKAGSQIAKTSGERFSPFYGESFDRIIRDESELDERWQSICNGPVLAELASEPEAYAHLWVIGVA